VSVELIDAFMRIAACFYFDFNQLMGLLMKKLSSFRAVALALACAASGFAQAHDAFFELASPAQAGQFIVRFADEGKPIAYPASKLKRTWALSTTGQAVALQQTPAADFVRIAAPADAAMMALEFENGFFSRTTAGTIEKPMNEVPNAVSAVWAKKAGKYITQWSAPVNKPVGLQLEIVPMSTALPKPGETIQVQVLWEGKPIEGMSVSKGEKEPGEKTDANGMASFKVQAGSNFVWAERRIPVAGDPRYTTLAVATNLIFVSN
jgi:nickel transport protein